MEHEAANGSVLTLERYQRMLDAMDWQYEYSDDQRVWRYGLEQQKMLWALAQKHGPEFMDAYFATRKKFNPPVFEEPQTQEPDY